MCVTGEEKCVYYLSCFPAVSMNSSQAEILDWDPD